MGKKRGPKFTTKIGRIKKTVQVDPKHADRLLKKYGSFQLAYDIMVEMYFDDEINNGCDDTAQWHHERILQQRKKRGEKNGKQ